MKALMLLTNGFEEVEAIGSAGIIRRAKISLDMASLHGTSATGRFGVTVTNLLKIEEIIKEDYDCLIIPGGPQYVEFESSQVVKNLILYFFNNNKYIAAICAGPTILGHLGLLKNKDYVCFKSMNEDFGGRFIDQYVVCDGKLITAVSAAASINFGLMIVEKLGSKDLRKQEEQRIYYKN